MLKSIKVRGFKSLGDVGPVNLAPFTVLFGSNAAGKSNLLDAVQLLSRLASKRNLADALGGPIRGLALEAFTLPREGLPKLLAMESARFQIGGDLLTKEKQHFEYRVEVAIKPQSGALTVENEYLAMIGKTGGTKGEPIFEKVEEKLRIRRKGGTGNRPREEQIGLGFTHLSDERLSGSGYAAIEKARDEMSSWRTYYLDPRVAMRAPQSPREVDDIGPLGEFLAPYLYRLKEEHPKTFLSVRRIIRTLIPSIEDLVVELDKRRGVLDIEIVQDGTRYSSRILSEGTLRVMALACVATNPWGGSLVAFEEPENGVHPRRIELIAEMLVSLATDTKPPRQVIVTTHSPIFCGAAIRLARGLRAEGQPDAIALYHVTREDRDTIIEPFETAGPMFDDANLAEALTAPTEDGVFEGFMLRGYLDA